jgi:putative methyltransferase (TIGR04325 family)
MRVLTLLRYAVPLGFLEIKKRFFPKKPFEGVYANFQEVPTSGPGFQGEVWLSLCRQRLAALLEAKSENYFLSEQNGEIGLLSLLASFGKKTGAVRILDFGGGLGFTYLLLKKTLVGSSLDYHIVENTSLCGEGRNLFKDDPSLHFHSEPPSSGEPFNIVFVSTALQYIQNYRAMIDTLLAVRPRFFFLSRFSTSLTQPTFATAQVNVKGSRIPYWVMNGDEIVALLKERGYTLHHRALRSQFPPLEKGPDYAVTVVDFIFEQTPHD